MYRSQFMAACILVLLTPVVALSTMTIGWGPNRVASVNNAPTTYFSISPSTLSLDPDYVCFGNGSQYGTEMRSTIVFIPAVGNAVGVEVATTVSSCSTVYVDDGSEIASFIAPASSVEVDMIGEYKSSTSWVVMTNFNETTFNYISYP